MNDVLHRTTYVWKEESHCGIIIKNDGNKIILNPKATVIWKCVNDENTVLEVIQRSIEDTSMTQEEAEMIIDNLIYIEVITNEDLFWGDDLL